MIKIDRYKCGYCGACVTVCPTDAIDLIGAWIEIREEDCNNCKFCVNICPVGALEELKEEVVEKEELEE
jgi:ferredoxin